MRSVLVIGNNYKFNKNDFIDSYVIGIDKGALYCLKNDIKMDLAVGDFDSISNDDFKAIKKITKVIKLNPIKDDTDTEHALNLVKDYDEILILGGIKGNRIEHFISMLLYLKTYPNLKIKDDNSLIYSMNNDFILKKENEYKYISFFSIDNESIISLKGFKYDLDNYKLKENDPLCISNEIISDEAYVKLNGRLLIIMSKDDNI
ncbi:MAG: thiamine diphosphokinase [Acholeplasmatales bacterium]|nr:thiamine diphosphokinase [Acholeplasmatales bacterium]